MSRKLKDLTGQKFNKLTALKCIGRYHGEPLWKCKCECGGTATVRTSQLGTRAYISCGCEQFNPIKNVIHGEGAAGSQTKEYKTWLTMKARVNTNIYYINLGIKVCDRWSNSFPNFLKDVGRSPSPLHTLDRYPNQFGNYEPGNVRWATMLEQSYNRSNNTQLTFNGKTQTITEWAKELNINDTTLFARLYKQHWTPEEALTTPVKHRKRIRIGQHYNQLTILSIFSKIKNAKARSYVLCKCKCGNIIECRKDSVISGHTKSCGCIKSS